MTDCPHPSILRFVGDNVPSMWGCATCSQRFYPACGTCVTIGHRNDTDHAAGMGIDATCRDEGCQLQAQTLSYLAGSPRIDPDRLARALIAVDIESVGDKVVEWWRMGPKPLAAAIVKAYEEETT